MMVLLRTPTAKSMHVLAGTHRAYMRVPWTSRDYGKIPRRKLGSWRQAQTRPWLVDGSQPWKNRSIGLRNSRCVVLQHYVVAVLRIRDHNIGDYKFPCSCPDFWAQQLGQLLPTDGVPKK